MAHPDAIAKLRTYATRERNGARALADKRLSKSEASMIAAGEEIGASSYYRARQNAMDDILRLLAEVAPVEVRQ